jgi:hypothetical protein
MLVFVGRGSRDGHPVLSGAGSGCRLVMTSLHLPMDGARLRRMRRSRGTRPAGVLSPTSPRTWHLAAFPEIDRAGRASLTARPDYGFDVDDHTSRGARALAGFERQHAGGRGERWQT